MYKLDYSNTKKAYRTSIMFFLIGILLMIILVFFTFDGMFRMFKMNSTVEAYHVEIDFQKDSEGVIMYNPTYYYILDGKEYTYKPSSSFNRDVSKMQNPTLYYNSENPYDVVSAYETSLDWIDVVTILIVLILLYVSAGDIKKKRSQKLNMKKLSETGTLIKGLEYRMLSTKHHNQKKGNVVIEVDYELPSGSVITLREELNLKRKYENAGGLVDLLIDVNNPNNYYLDFEISELC